MQRCPKHPVIPILPPNRLRDNGHPPIASSVPQIPTQNPDLRMFSNVFNHSPFPPNSFPSHLHFTGHHQCSNLAHLHHHHHRNMAAAQSFMSPGGCHKPMFNKPNHPMATSNVAFIQREETCCRTRPQLSVRPKSCFAGGGVHSRSCSNSATTGNSGTSMFLSLPPVQPPPLAPKPPITGPNCNKASNSFCRSDDESADSASEIQCVGSNNSENVANGNRASSSKFPGGLTNAPCRPVSCALPVSSNNSTGNAASDFGVTEPKPSEAQSSTALNCRNANANDASYHSSAPQATTSQSNDTCFLSPHNLFTCFHHSSSNGNSGGDSSGLYQSIPYYRTKSCPPVNQNSIDQSNSSQSAPNQTSQVITNNAGICHSSAPNSAQTSTPLSCRQEAAVRNKLGLMSLAPPAAAFGGSPDRSHARTHSWSMSSGAPPHSANQNRKLSPTSRPNASGSGSQYNLCNNKSANIGDTSDSECYVSGDEAAAGTTAITNPEIRRRQMRKFRKLPRKPENLPKRSEKEEFVMLNKSPIWNESTQVYQLDFGGRVTQESAKNFQIEHNKDQVSANGSIPEKLQIALRCSSWSRVGHDF